MATALDNVHKLYIEGIADGNAREAIQTYTGHRYTQHSTGVGDGTDGFIAFFEPFVQRHPKRDIRILRSFQDGRWVFCSAYQDLNDGVARWVTMDMFYTDPEGRILEHWDTIAAWEDTASGNDMVGGTTEVDQTADGQANKALVLEYAKQVLQQGALERLDSFVDKDLIQHAAAIPKGRDGLAQWLRSKASGEYEMLFRVIGQGDMVVTFGKRHAQRQDIAVFDLFRLAGGKIVEQWSNPEPIAPRTQWGNSGKF